MTSTLSGALLGQAMWGGHMWRARRARAYTGFLGQSPPA